jgi:hypothetical protein
MSKREQVLEIVIKAMGIADGASESMNLYGPHGVGQDATDRIMELFNNPFQGGSELEHDLGPARSEACC